MERLRQVEEVAVLKGERRDTHARTHCIHEIIVDLDYTCRDGVRVFSEGVCTLYVYDACMCGYMSMCFLYVLKCN